MRSFCLAGENASSDNRGSSMPFASFRRSIMSIRSEQVHSVELNHDSTVQEIEQGVFQNLVATRFQELSVASGDEFLSIAWVRKLLDVFNSCQEEFRIVLSNNKELLVKSPQDKLLSDYFDRTIKALDICNAARDGTGKIRLWQKHLEIVVSSLDSRQNMIGDGQLRRTRKSLMDLAIVMLEEKETGTVLSQRNRSLDAIIKPRITSVVLLGTQGLYLGVYLNLGQHLNSSNQLQATWFLPVDMK